MYRELGAERHDELLRLLVDLEAVQLGCPDALAPAPAVELQAAVWEFLKAYGRRDPQGAVDADLEVSVDPEGSAAHPEQVRVLGAQQKLEPQVIVDVADLDRHTDRGDRDGVADVKAVGCDAGRAVEVRVEGLARLGHDLSMEVPRGKR